jgi:hypothetical protein
MPGCVVHILAECPHPGLGFSPFWGVELGKEYDDNTLHIYVQCLVDPLIVEACELPNLRSLSSHVRIVMNELKPYLYKGAAFHTQVIVEEKQCLGTIKLGVPQAHEGASSCPPGGC